MKPRSACAPVLRGLLGLLGLLAAISPATSRPACAGSFPLPGSAPGSQTATADPFVGLANRPEADLFTGSARTAIAIEVPPGRANMTPRLALSYSSNGGPGPIGHGWTLPVGRIARSTKHGPPSWDDSADTFVLELPGRSTELIELGGGRYRARHEGDYLKIVRARTGSHWVVFDRDGTQYVFGRSPATRNSRLGLDIADGSRTFAWLLEQIVDPWGNSIDFVYLPRDAKDADGPGGRLGSVHYGGNTSLPGEWPDEIDHLFRVDFIWSTQASAPAMPWRSYDAGFARNIDDRIALEQITTRYRDVDGIERVARTYELSYEVDSTTLIRHLQSVTLRADGDDGTTVLPASVFVYSPSLQRGYPVGSPSTRRDRAVRFESPGPIHDRNDKVRFDIFDIDSDGIVDYVDATRGVRFGMAGGLGFEPEWTEWPWPPDHDVIRKISDSENLHSNIFDLNGDSLPDFVDAAGKRCIGQCTDCAAGCWDVYLNEGGGFALEPVAWPAPASRIRDAGSSGVIHQDTIDLDGDGLPDFVDSRGAPDGFWDVYRNNGAGFDVHDVRRWPVPAVGDRIGHAARSDAVTFTWSGLIDLNADGLPDLINTRPGYSRESRGQHGERAEPYGSDPASQLADKRTDHWVVHFNNGSGFEPAFLWRVEGAAVSDRRLHGHYRHDKSGTAARTFSDLVDITGDGLPDLVRRVDGGDLDYPLPSCRAEALSCADGREAPECCEAMLLFVNTGASFSAPVAIPAWEDEHTLRAWHDGSSPVSGREFDLLDFDGDGLIDLVERVGVEWHIYRHPASPFAQSGSGTSTPIGLRSRPNLLVAMMSGTGAESLLEYAPVTSLPGPRCERDRDGPSQQGRCLPFPYWVVSAHSHGDPSSPVPLAEIAHTYVDPLYSAREREFRGFAEVATVDAAGRSEVAGFHQDDARAGIAHTIDRLGRPDCEALDPDDPQDPCSPWQFAITSTEHEWDTGPVVLRSTKTIPHNRVDGRTEPVPHLQKIVDYEYDGYGNRTRETTRTASHTYIIEREYNPRVSSRSYQVNKPTRIRGYEQGGDVLFDQVFRYRKGAPVRSEACQIIDGESCRRWARTRIKHWKPSGQIRRIKSPSRATTRWRYDEDSLGLVETRRPSGLVMRHRHDRGTGLERRREMPDGRVEETDHDGLGRPIEVRTLSEDGVLFVERSAQYSVPIPTLGLPGRTRIDAVGQAPIVTFHDGVGHTIATKTLVDATAYGVTAVVSGLRRFGTDGQVLAEAAPLESGNNDVDTLEVSFSDAPPTHRTIHEYEHVTGRLARSLRPDGTSLMFHRSIAGVRAAVDANLSGSSSGRTSNSPSGLSGSATDSERADCADSTGSVEIEYLDALGRTVRRDQCAIVPTLGPALRDKSECPQACLLARTDYEHDALDRVTVIRSHALETGLAYDTARYEYDGLGNRTAVVGADGARWQTDYTASGRVRRQTDPDGRSVLYAYDRADRPAAKRAGNSTVDYDYHTAGPGAGRLASVSVRSSGTLLSRRRLSYNRRGLPFVESLEIQTPTGNAVASSSWQFERSYDLADRLTSATYPAADGAERVRTEYSQFGRPIALRSDRQEIVSTARYDLQGRVVEIHYGNGLTDRLGYDGPEGLSRLRCLRTSAAAEGGGPPCAAGPSDLSAIRIETRDPTGRITTILDEHSAPGHGASSSRSHTYDPLGRLVETLYDDGTVSRADYDSIGNLVQRDETPYIYDALSNRPHTLLQSGDGLVIHDRSGNRTRRGLTAYSYDDFGRLTAVSDGSGERVRFFHADAADRIGRHDLINDRVIHYFSGQFELDTDSREVIRHFYLGDRQVASDSQPAGHGLSFNRRHSAGNALAAQPVTNAGPRDGRSRLQGGPQRIFGTTNDQSRAAFGGLAACSPIAALACLAIAALAGGRRRGTAILAAVLYLTAMSPGVGITAGAIGFEPQRDSALRAAAAVQAKSAVRDSIVFHHLDSIGSVGMLTAADGSIIEKLSYDPFGMLRGAFDATGNKVATGFEPTSVEVGFTGAQIDREAGLIDFGERFYDPELALFLTVDPAEQFASPYSYAAWDPVNLFDPDGRFLPLLAAAAFLGETSALIATTSLAVATGFLDGLLRSGDLGAALQAGAFAGVSAVGTAGISAALLGPITALTGLDTARLAVLDTAASAFGAVQNFREGSIARGLAATLNFVSRLGTFSTQALGPSEAGLREPDGAVLSSTSRRSSSGAPGALDGAPLDHELWIAARSTEADGKIGHSFVALGRTSAELEVYGFYPAEPLALTLRDLTRTVDGTVVEGVDAAGLERAIRGESGHGAVKYAITRPQYDAALAEINRYRGLSYNAARCNCTSFAVDVARAAGVAAPYAGVVPRPAVLLRGIRKRTGR